MKSKREKAQTIFDNNKDAVKAGTTTRKQVIAKMVKSAGLTENGAATYYQQMKNPTVKKGPTPEQKQATKDAAAKVKAEAAAKKVADKEAKAKAKADAKAGKDASKNTAQPAAAAGATTPAAAS